MKRLLLLSLMLLPTMALARQSAQGDCVLGGKVVVTNGLNSTTKVLASYPSCTVTVSVHGGGLATIYSDNAGTVLANPFTATTAGHWAFYADGGRYDVLISGGTPQAMPSSFTYSDILLNDSSQLSTSVCGLAFASPLVFTAATCSDFTLTLTGNVTSSSITGAIVGQQVSTSICQDGTGGRTFSWPPSFTRPPTIDPRAGTCTNATFFFDGINWRQMGATGDSLMAASGGTLAGTFSGAPVFSGNITISGNPTISGNIASSGLNTFTGNLNTFTKAVSVGGDFTAYSTDGSVNVKGPGIDARGNGQQDGGDNEGTGHGQMTAGSAVLTDTFVTFTTADVGKLIVVYGAGPPWPTRQALTTYPRQQLVYQNVTQNGIPNVGLLFYARIGGTTGAGAVTWPTTWAGPVDTVLHLAGEVVDGGVTWDLVGSTPNAFNSTDPTVLANQPLRTTITGFTDSHHVTLAAPASTSVTTAKVQWATDDTAAINAANTAACNIALANASYATAVVVWPRGMYGISNTISPPSCFESGLTWVAEHPAGGGQQEAAFIWNWNVNADAIDYVSNTLSFTNNGVGVIGLGAGYGAGQGIVFGSPTLKTYEGGVFNAWVGNNPMVNIRLANVEYAKILNNSLGGSEIGLFIDGGQSTNPTPCGQSKNIFATGNYYFAMGAPNLLVFNSKYNELSGSTFGPGTRAQLTDTSTGAIQFEADNSGVSGISSCTYNNIANQEIFFQNGNDFYVTGPAGFHPTNNQLSGTSSNTYQSVVKIANGDGNNIGPLSVFQSGGCYLPPNTCTNAGASVVDIGGTSANNYLGSINNFYVVNPGFNPNYGIELGATTTSTRLGANFVQAVTASLHVEPGATTATTDMGETVFNSDIAKTTAVTNTEITIKSIETTNPLELLVQLVGSATGGAFTGNRGFIIQSTEPGVSNRTLWLNPNGGPVKIGSPSPPSTNWYGLEVSGGIGIVEAATPSTTGGLDVIYGDSTSHTLKASLNGAGFLSIPLVIASGTAAMTTAGIATGACGTTVTVAATGIVTTDTIDVARNAAATIGNGGGLTLNWWPTVGNVNFNYCNSAAGTITPTAMTVNWSVRRP